MIKIIDYTDILGNPKYEMEPKLNLSINTKFKFNRNIIKVIKSNNYGCNDCYFYGRQGCCQLACLPSERIRKTNVIFKKVDKQ